MEVISIIPKRTTLNTAGSEATRHDDETDREPEVLVASVGAAARGVQHHEAQHAGVQDLKW